MTPRKHHNLTRHGTNPHVARLSRYDHFETVCNQQLLSVGFRRVVIRSALFLVGRENRTLPGTKASPHYHSPAFLPNRLPMLALLRPAAPPRLGAFFVPRCVRGVPWVKLCRFPLRNPPKSTGAKCRIPAKVPESSKSTPHGSLSAISRASLVQEKQRLGWHTSAGATFARRKSGCRANTSRRPKPSAPSCSKSCGDISEARP